MRCEMLYLYGLLDPNNKRLRFILCKRLHQAPCRMTGHIHLIIISALIKGHQFILILRQPVCVFPEIDRPRFHPHRCRSAPYLRILLEKPSVRLVWFLKAVGLPVEDVLGEIAFVELADQCELVPVHCSVFVLGGFGFHEYGFFHIAFYQFLDFLAGCDAFW